MCSFQVSNCLTRIRDFFVMYTLYSLPTKMFDAESRARSVNGYSVVTRPKIISLSPVVADGYLGSIGLCVGHTPQDSRHH
jgi:hypothetical protein